MNTPDARAEARNRANRRLHRMTIATAALGVASVGLLSATAALSYDGTHASGATVALVTTDDDTTTTASIAAGGSSSSSSTSTTPAVTSGSGTAHVSTGGS